MSWLASFKLNGMAKAYSRKLPMQLYRGWGYSRYYPPGQIKASVEKAGLNPRYLAIGYAAFLQEADYLAAVADLSIQFDFETARAAFSRYLPSSPASATSDASTTKYY